MLPARMTMFCMGYLRCFIRRDRPSDEARQRPRDGACTDAPRRPLDPQGGTWRGQAWHTPTRVPPRGVAGLGRTGLGDQSGGGTGLFGAAWTETECGTLIHPRGTRSPLIAHPKAMNLSHTLIPATIARIRRSKTAGRPKRIRHRSQHHLMQGFERSEVLPRDRDVPGPRPSTPQGPPQHGSEPPLRRHYEVRPHLSLPVEKPLAQGIEVDHRRNGNDSAAAAADQRQHDTWIERMFRDAMGQCVTRHGGGHRKETERPEAKEGVQSKAENGNDERDGERRPRQAGKERQAETGTATMNLQERGDPGHDRQRKDREAEGQNAESDRQRDGKKDKRH